MTNKYLEKIAQTYYQQPQQKKKNVAAGIAGTGLIAAGGGLAGKAIGERIGESQGRAAAAAKVPTTELDPKKLQRDAKKFAKKKLERKTQQHKEFMGESKKQQGKAVRQTYDIKRPLLGADVSKSTLAKSRKSPTSLERAGVTTHRKLSMRAEQRGLEEKQRIQEQRDRAAAKQRQRTTKGWSEKQQNKYIRKMQERAAKADAKAAKKAGKVGAKSGRVSGGRLGGIIGLGLAGAAGFSALMGD